MIRPLIPVVKNGETPSDERLLSLIRPLIPVVRNGNDGSPDTGEDIVIKVNGLPTDNPDLQIDASHIKNLPKLVSTEAKKINRGGQNISIKDEGSVLTAKATSIDFVGAGVAATASGNDVTVTIASTGGGHTIKDESTTLTQRAVLRFAGSGVSAADSGGETVVTVAAAPVPVAGAIASPTSGTRNGSNTAFVFDSKPELIIVDGLAMRSRSGDAYDSASTQWTWTAGTFTATLPYAPDTTSEIFGTSVITP